MAILLARSCSCAGWTALTECGWLFQRGALGHVGHDGCTAGERANRYGTWHKAYGENLAYFCWNGASTCLRRQPCTCGGVGSLTFRRGPPPVQPMTSL